MNFPSVYLALIALCVVTVASSEASDHDCGENGKYVDCVPNPGCLKTCANIDTWDETSCFSLKVCTKGCDCDEGYVLDEEGGACVRENSCPRVRH